MTAVLFGVVLPVVVIALFVLMVVDARRELRDVEAEIEMRRVVRAGMDERRAHASVYSSSARCVHAMPRDCREERRAA